MTPLQTYAILTKVRNLRVTIGMPLSYGNKFKVSFVNFKWIATKK